mmetsp:Transcript_81222/g.224844  ORF Transcript_81222/g.224844 Transcript_81222/m.224844 type:complete len:330 (-) Transcript_81222:1291-2280(-)
MNAPCSSGSYTANARSTGTETDCSPQGCRTRSSASSTGTLAGNAERYVLQPHWRRLTAHSLRQQPQTAQGCRARACRRPPGTCLVAQHVPLELGCSRLPQLAHERVELPGFSQGEERCGGVELRHASGLQKQDPVATRNRVQPVRDGQHRPINKLRLDDLLDRGVGADVNVCSCLVHADDPRLPQQRTRQADQLPLATGEVLTALTDVGVQAARQVLHDGLQGGVAQRRPELVLRALAEEVQVLPHRARKHDRVLGDDREAAAQVAEPQLCNVHPVDQDLAFAPPVRRGNVNQTEEHGKERRLATASATTNADLHAAFNHHRDPVQYPR